MKKFVIGDIHGGHKAMLQCFERSGFDKNNDKLICIGDVSDGWVEVPECIEELLSIKNLVYIIGNHDSWLHEYFQYGESPMIWLSQGGQATVKAYLDKPLLQEKHKDFFTDKPFYHVEDNRLFVHGGFNALQPIEYTMNHDLIWDRNMWFDAVATSHIDDPLKAKRRIEYQMKHINDYKEIFIGHTTTSRISDEPVNALNIWNVDQGGGWEGKLTIMNVETKEFWQSDKVSALYPGVKGRGG